MARSMPMREPRLLLAALAIALAGCSTDPALYPSLSIRDAERVSGTFEPVEPERYVPPPPGQPVLDELGRYEGIGRVAVTTLPAQAKADIESALGQA